MKIGNRNAGFALIVLDKELCREVCLARIHTACTAIHTIPTIFHAATHTINNYAVFPHSNPDCDSQSKSCSALTQHDLPLTQNKSCGALTQHRAGVHRINHVTPYIANHTAYSCNKSCSRPLPHRTDKRPAGKPLT